MARTDGVDDPARAAFKSLFGPLLVAHRRTFDVLEWTVFFEALADVPTPLLQAAVRAMIRQPRRYPFRPADVREVAETCRQDLLRRHPHEPCEACQPTGGWLTVTDAQGVERLTKCPCIAAWREQLEQIGVTVTPVFKALPAPELEGSEV